MTKYTKFYGTWEEWLNINIKRGCCKDELFKILLENNFDYNLIKNKLKIDYVDVNQNQNQNQNNLKNFYNINIKNAIKLKSNLIQLYTIDKFLTKDECNKIIYYTSNKLIKSEITSKEEKDKKFRTSKTCHISSLNKDGFNYLKYIDNKICNILSIPKKYSEDIQIQSYDVGQEFKLHTDYFDKIDNNNFCKKQGNRTWTFMVYLNDTQEGGATYIPAIKERFYPKTGKALIWNNLLEDGSNNINTLHAGEPIIKGRKIIITKWFRQKE
tara:strand:- start:17182 stop:17988 length:807 start_codon:yes stop_codon:yes gene_type:complete